MNARKITLIAVIPTTLVILYFVPTNEFFGIDSYYPESPSPMMVLENNSDEIMRGFKITPVSCSTTDMGLNESHFQITNTHNKDYDITVGVMFTDNSNVLYEKKVGVRILAGDTIDQIHLSDRGYDNPICVVQINDWAEI